MELTLHVEKANGERISIHGELNTCPLLVVVVIQGLAWYFDTIVGCNKGADGNTELEESGFITMTPTLMTQLAMVCWCEQKFSPWLFSMTVFPTMATGILQSTPRTPVLPKHVSLHPFLQLVVENMQGPLRFKLVDEPLASYSGWVAQKTIHPLHFVLPSYVFTKRFRDV